MAKRPPHRPRLQRLGLPKSAMLCTSRAPKTGAARRILLQALGRELCALGTIQSSCVVETLSKPHYARNLTCLFRCNCLFESKHPIIKPPPKSQLITPPPSVSRGADVWCPYPCPAEGITGPPLGTVLTSIQSAVSKLDCIAYDLCRVFWDAQSEYTDHSSDRLSAAAAQLRIRISAWTGQLEESLQEGKSDTPHVLGLQYVIHSPLPPSLTHPLTTCLACTTPRS